MKFSCEITIDKPVEIVIKQFFNLEGLKEWQDNFIRKEELSGTPGKEGATAKMYYKMGRSEMVLHETIQKSNLPEEFKGLYEHKHMTNTMSTHLESISPDQTKLIQHVEYIKFNGLIPKLMARLFPGMFKKQVNKWLVKFKTYIETH